MQGRRATVDFLRALHSGYFPDVILAQCVSGTASAATQLDGKAVVDGRPTAYVCHGFTCSAPVTSAEALIAALQEPLPA